MLSSSSFTDPEVTGTLGIAMMIRSASRIFSADYSNAPSSCSLVSAGIFPERRSVRASAYGWK
jgi:hypothetical protein